MSRFILSETTKQLSDFDPRSIPGNYLWLDASDRSSFTLNANNIVTAITDKSANAMALTTTIVNATTGYAWSATSFNTSYPAFFTTVTTAGGNFNLAAANTTTATVFGTSLQSVGTPMTVFCVCQSDATSAGANAFILDSPNRISINGPNATVFNIGVTAGSFISAPFSSVTSPTIITGLYNVGTASILYSNGAQTATGTLAAQTFGTGTPSALTIGSRFGTTQAWYGKISEILFYNSSLTTAERKLIEGYLSLKWGLQASYPNTLIKPFLREFTPPDITGCLLWFDGRDATSITSGANITAWADKSGNANNLTWSSNHPLSYTASTGYLSLRSTTNGTTTTPITFTSSTATTAFFVTRPTFPTNVGTYHNYRFQSGTVAPLFFHSFATRHSINGFYMERGPSGGFLFGGPGSFNATAVSGNGTIVSYTTNTGITTDCLTSAGGIVAITGTGGTTSAQTISTITGNGTTVTVTFATSHPFSVGQNIAISGVSVNGYNTVNAAGNGVNNTVMTTVESVPNSTSITYLNTTSAAATGGTVTGSYDGVYNAASYATATGVLTYSNTMTNTATVILTVTGATGTGTLATLTFTNPVAGTPILFIPGQILTVQSMNPSQYNSSNGDSKVISCTANTVTYTNTTSTTFVSGGTIRSVISFPTATNNYVWISCMQRNTATNFSYSMNGNLVTQTGASGANSGAHTFSFTGSMPCDVGEVIMYDGAISSQDRQRVEGYLIWKWGNQRITGRGGSHFNTNTLHPFYRFPTVTAPFNPLAISSLSMWYDGSDAKTVSGSGTSAFAWTDKTGITLSARASGGSTSYATLAANSVNGLSSVYIDNNTQAIRLNSGGSSSFGYVSGQITFFLVFNTTATGAHFADLNGGLVGSAFWTTTGITFAVYGTNSSTISTTALVGNTAIICVTSSGPSSIGRLYLNGNLQSTTVTTGSTVYTAVQPILSRDAGAGPTYYCEALGFSTLLTTSQRQQIEGYLAWKWGLQTTLPSTHPYYKLRL